MNKINNVISFYQLIEIRFADPVSSIGLNEKFIVSGTMMGRISLFNIEEKKTYLLFEISNENVTGITFEDSDTFNIAIGDDEVIKYKVKYDSDSQICQEFLRFKNYDDEASHKALCDGCFSLLSQCHLLIINLNQSSESGSISMIKTSVKVPS